MTQTCCSHFGNGLADLVPGLLNVEGYYDDLIRFLENAFTQQFVNDLYRPILITADEPAKILDQFAVYRAPAVRKWMGEDEL